MAVIPSTVPATPTPIIAAVSLEDVFTPGDVKTGSLYITCGNIKIE